MSYVGGKDSVIIIFFKYNPLLFNALTINSCFISYNLNTINYLVYSIVLIYNVFLFCLYYDLIQINYCYYLECIVCVYIHNN